MLFWIAIFYVTTALACTGVVLTVRHFFTGKTSRYWIFVLGLTLSWTPTFITAWHSVGVSQLLLALYFGEWLSRESPWELVAATGLTFLSVWMTEKKLRARAERRKGQRAKV